MNKLIDLAKIHAKLVQKHFNYHIKTHKHHYGAGLFGSFALVKMIMLIAWLFGVSTIPSSFAAYLDNGFIISEYIEGSSFNKAIELYNGTNHAVDLSEYKLVLYANWSATPSQTMIPVGVLNPWDVYVIAHPSANATILGKANATNSMVINFNGDDAIALMRTDNSYVDVIGQIGFDPGTSWNSWWVSTADRTLVRKAMILTGDTNGSNIFDPSLEWNSYPTDTVSYLWTHSIDATAPIPTINLANGQTSPTTSLTWKFQVSFSEAINTWTFSCSDITLIGSAPWKTCIHLYEIAPNNRTTFEIVTTATNDWVVTLTIPAGGITDLAGNPNSWVASIINDTITIDRSSLRLTAWSVVIVTANTNPDLFEFLVYRTIPSWTTIYFSDNARSGDNTRRTTEGNIVFTSTTDIPAGTIVSIQGTDTAIPTIMQAWLWSVSKTGDFNLAANGDNIIVYQWDYANTPTPIFIHGFWFWSANPWIVSWAPTANISYLPATLSLWTNSINYDTSHRNTQYLCTNRAMLSNTFVTDIHNKINWAGNDISTGSYLPISCVFDATQPEVEISLASSQTNPSASFTGKFLITFSEAINTGTFTCSDIGLVGTAWTKTCTAIEEIAPNDGTTFEATVTVTNIWFVRAEIEPEKITDLAWNPNDFFTWDNNSITIINAPTYQDDLLLYLPLDSDTNDHSGNGNHGTNYGAVSASGQVNWAYTLSGNAYISVPQSSTLSTAVINGNFTISFWWAFPTNTDVAVVSQSPGGGDTPKRMFAIQNRGQKIWYYSRDGAVIERQLATYTFTPHSDLQHYTLVKNGSDFFLYHNAIQVAHSTDSPTPLADLGMAFEIGRAESNFYYNNILDEVAIRWRALSSSEVAGLYNWGSGLSLLPAPTTYTLTYTAGSNGSLSWTLIQTINEGEDGTMIEAIPDDWYRFVQRSDNTTDNPRLDTNIMNNISVTAQFEEVKDRDGWWSYLIVDDCPEGDLSPSYYDKSCEALISHAAPLTTRNIYTWSRTLTRKTLALLIDTFAQKALPEYLTIANQDTCLFGDTDWLSEKDKTAINNVCANKLMWRMQDGMQKKEKFEPYAIVSYEEAATVFSRLLYGNIYNISLDSNDIRYEQHVEHIRPLWLLTQDQVSINDIINALIYIQKHPILFER